jgi:hypothetical protein
LNRLLLCAALCLCAGLARAEEVVEMRAGAGLDIVHQQGMAMLSVAVHRVSFLAWNNRNYGLGVTYPFGRAVGWNAGLGGILVRRTDDNVGTRLNLLIRASHCWDVLCLSYAHISHAEALGIRRDAANSGLNFLYVEYRSALR